MTETVSAAVEALRRGGIVVLPTDTVYGLACDPGNPDAVGRLYALKGRGEAQPTALVAASLDALFDRLPELRGQAAAVARALLPASFTLVLPNPERRFPWLAGGRPETIGVRVPDLSGPGGEVLAEVGTVAATSANPAGGADPRCLDDVEESLRLGVDARVDGGILPGIPSTVLDLTGESPRLLREGAVPGTEALALAQAALAGT
jgi:L-threonylcarbamoyladenylate synthase